ncbi:hypothetical protein [Sphingobacterium spiritivorum]|uniref:hypothetical protein n=1 Tax=Sphingobacterium spiritivorum TaxID=258 RepID=UPI003DA65CDC
MTHTEIVHIAYKWLKKRYPVAFKEFSSLNLEIPDVIGFRSFESAVIEVKVSRSDFLRDRKKLHKKFSKGMGMFRFYCCPAGLIKIEDLPDNWGLVYVDQKNKCQLVHNPYNLMGGNIWSNGFDRDIEAEYRLMYSALRKSGNP